MRQPLAHAVYDTPFGDLHVFATEDGVVRASGFRELAAIAAHLPDDLRVRGWDDAPLPVVEAAVAAWLAGDGDALAAVPVAQEGGPFFQEVWATLRAVPGGEPLSYQELAAAAGRPLAMRAVGTACARNAVAPFVPCHRVIGAGGRLGSYGYGGPGPKAAMLALECGGGAAEIARAEASATVTTQAPRRALAHLEDGA